MSRNRRLALCVASAVAPLLGSSSSLLGDAVIGNWENSTDGWIDWSTQGSIDPNTNPKYSYTPNGATLGSSALQISQNGWGQNLSIKLQNNGLKDTFFANTQFSIDFSVPAQAAAGWTEVYTLWINAQNYGFTDQQSTYPKKQFGWAAGGGGAQSTTLTWDYSALVDGNPNNGEISPSAGWVELILATNGQDADHGIVQFDNARLTSPFVRVDLNGGGTGTLHPTQLGFTPWTALPTSGQGGNGAQNGYPAPSVSNSFTTGTVASGAIQSTLTSVDVGGTGTPAYLPGASPDVGPRINAFDMSFAGREFDGSGNFTPTKDSLYRDYAIAEAGTATTNNGTNHRMELKFEGLDPNTPYKLKFYAYDNSNPQGVSVFTDVTKQPLIFMPSGQSGNGNFTPGDGSGGTQYAPAGQYIDGTALVSFPASDDFRAIELYATSDGSGRLIFAETTISGLSGSTQVLPVLNGYEIQKDLRSWTGTSSANWTDAGNWTGGVPNVKGQIANFGTSPVPTVTLDASVTLGRINFNSTSLNIAGSAGNTLTLDDTSINSTLSFQNTGRTEINLNSGSSDQTISANLFMNKDTQVSVVNAGTTLTLSSLQPAAVNLSKVGAGTLQVNNVRVNGLIVNTGKVQLLANGQAAGVSRANSLAVLGSSQLDVSDNHVITQSAVGSWTGASYSGLTGQIASGRNGNLWNGPGIITTQTAAQNSNHTSIGIARASDVRPSTATATGLWAGQTITGTDTLVMYTYGGDANLDGKINIDDYIRTDAGFAGHLTGWSNGDFNYDGVVNIDDYVTVIDANFPNQTGAFYAAGGAQAAGSEITAVPEPAAACACVVFAMVYAGRGRRQHRRRVTP